MSKSSRNAVLFILFCGFLLTRIAFI